MDIAYKAQTDACTFLLDGKGICRSVLAASSNAKAGRPVRIPSTAERCIGAQYVACIDMREAGAMVATPRAGAQMLFARTDKDGHITLVRTGAIVRFETVALDSGVRERPEPPEYDVDDEELTAPLACATVPFKRELLAPIMRAAAASARLERPTPRADTPSVPPPRASSTPPARASSIPPARASSIPPAIPNRTSGVVPTYVAGRAAIPPPPPAMRNSPSYAPPPSYGSPSYAPPAPPASSGPTLQRRPSIVRISVPSWDDEEEAPPTRKRAARR